MTRLILYALEIYMNGITTHTLLVFQYVLHFIHVSTRISSSLLFYAKSDSIIRINITKFISSPIDGYLDFHDEKPSNNFPKWFYYFTLPSTKSSSCFPSLPTLSVVTVSQNHCGFNLYTLLTGEVENLAICIISFVKYVLFFYHIPIKL